VRWRGAGGALTAAPAQQRPGPAFALQRRTAVRIRRGALGWLQLVLA
jgi:hypothetical protein